jgi:hypothetical protein
MSGIRPQCVIPVKSTLIPGNSEVCLRVDVMKRVALRFLAVPRDISQWFMINDIKVGRNCQFLAEGGVPAGVFASDPMILETVEIGEVLDVRLDHPIPLAFDTVGPERPIILRVQNLAAWAVNFSACFYGELHDNGE